MESSASKSESPLAAELRAIEDAFEAGNYRKVRAEVARIEASDASDDDKKAARELKARTEPSRAQIALLAIAALLVVALSGYEIFEHGRNTPRPTPKPTIERVTK
jgi:hypothetical protein